MSDNNRRLEPPDLGVYHENRRKFPPEKSASYAGRYVAFSPDGTRILASGDSEEEVEKRLRAAGIPPSQVMGAYIDPLDQVALG
jgi:hypothetical protein